MPQSNASAKSASGTLFNPPGTRIPRPLTPKLRPALPHSLHSGKPSHGPGASEIRSTGIIGPGVDGCGPCRYSTLKCDQEKPCGTCVTHNRKGHCTYISDGGPSDNTVSMPEKELGQRASSRTRQASTVGGQRRAEENKVVSPEGSGVEMYGFWGNPGDSDALHPSQQTYEKMFGPKKI